MFSRRKFGNENKDDWVRQKDTQVFFGFAIGILQDFLSADPQTQQKEQYSTKESGGNN